jgi:DNA polymerase-3 subunit alpha
LEALAYSGGFDSFGIERHPYFCKDDSNKTFIESLLAYSNKLKSATNLSGNMLFDLEDTIQIDKPTPPTTCQEWTIPEKLNYERQSIGIYLSSHPLDNYQFFIDHFTNFKVANFDDLTDTVLVKRYMGKDLTTIAYVTKAQEAQTKTGNPYGRFTIEDKTGSYQMMLFSKDYVKFKNYLTKDYTLHITGELRKSYRDENLQEYRVKNIQLADEFINNIERTLLFRIHHDEITEDLLKTFSALKDMEKGNCSVKLKIVHENPNFSLNTISRTIRLKLTGQLMNFLTNNGFSIIPSTDIKKSSYIRKLVII